MIRPLRESRSKKCSRQAGRKRLRRSSSDGGPSFFIYKLVYSGTDKYNIGHNSQKVSCSHFGYIDYSVKGSA